MNEWWLREYNKKHATEIRGGIKRTAAQEEISENRSKTRTEDPIDDLYEPTSEDPEEDDDSPTIGMNSGTENNMEGPETFALEP